MPDPHHHWSLRIARRLLPASVRTLVFDPLCADLLRDYHFGDRSRLGKSRLVLRVTRACVESMLFGFPRYFREPGRTTRLGKASLIVGGSVLSLLVVLLAPWIAELARASSP